jgi:hypothetical protein
VVVDEPVGEEKGKKGKAAKASTTSAKAKPEGKAKKTASKKSAE